MKKKCSLLMTPAVLICAAMTFTGCGRLGLQSGQVYQNEEDSSYWCFHSDGRLYKGTINADGKIDAKKLEQYFIEGDKIKIKLLVNSIDITAEYNFKLEKSCLMLKQIQPPFPISPGIPKKMILTAWPTEDEMKKAVKW